MKLFLDFFPIALFFAAFKYYDNMVPATVVLMVASIVQLIGYRLATGSVPRMQLFTALFIVAFGCLTVFMNDSSFIQHKPTVLYCVLAVFALLSNFTGKQPLMQRTMGASLPAPTRAWRIATFALTGFFVASALANHYVVTHYSENTWMNFKLFGMLGATLLFTFGIAYYLYQQVPADQREALFKES